YCKVWLCGLQTKTTKAHYILFGSKNISLALPGYRRGISQFRNAIRACKSMWKREAQSSISKYILQVFSCYSLKDSYLGMRVPNLCNSNFTTIGTIQTIQFFKKTIKST